MLFIKVPNILSIDFVEFNDILFEQELILYNAILY